MPTCGGGSKENRDEHPLRKVEVPYTGVSDKSMRNGSEQNLSNSGSGSTTGPTADATRVAWETSGSAPRGQERRNGGQERVPRF